MEMYNHHFNDDQLRRRRQSAIRNIQPVRSATKMLNMFWINQKLEMVLSELKKDKGRNTELIQAAQLVEIIQTLLKHYSDGIREHAPSEGAPDDGSDTPAAGAPNGT